MKIGIIGSGIAGLSAGWFLSQDGHQVSIFERGTKPGMSAHAVDFGKELAIPGRHGNDALDGKSFVGDVPSRMFNAQLWPNLVALYQAAGVPIQPVNHQQSFSDSHSNFLFQLELPYRLKSALGDALDGPKRKIISEVAKFKSAGQAALEAGLDQPKTFGEFAGECNLSQSMQNDFLFPVLSATVFTCPYHALREYPATVVLDALSKISSGQASLMQTVHGTRDVVQRLLKPVDSLYLSSEVKSLRHVDNQVEISTARGQLLFDHVVIATQANHVQHFGAEVSRDVLKTLNAFEYVNVRVVVHTDESFMPHEKKNWSTFNFESHQPTDSENDRSAMCTVWMNRFHDTWGTGSGVVNLFQTILPTRLPVESKTIRAFTLQRPIVNAATKNLLESLQQWHQQPNQRVWHVGSYAAPGVPLLESGVVSCQNIFKKIAQQPTGNCAIES